MHYAGICAPAYAATDAYSSCIIVMQLVHILEHALTGTGTYQPKLGHYAASDAHTSFVAHSTSYAHTYCI